MSTGDLSEMRDRDGEDLKHECAIFLAYSRPDSKVGPTNVLSYVLNGLKIQANRGQEGFGLATMGDSDGDEFRILRSTQSVTEISKLSDAEQAAMFTNFERNAIIGHNRYATHGPPHPTRSQPMQNGRTGSGNKADSKVIAFNGHIANADELREELEAAGYGLDGETDTEVLLQLITKTGLELGASGHVPDYSAIFSVVDTAIDGACSLVLLDGAGNAVLYRHSNGIRPLELFETEDGLILAASETEAFSGLVGQHRSINAGEIFHYSVERDSWSISRVGKANVKYCVLELLYFSRANSQYKGLTHYRIRRDIGLLMAETIREQVEGLSAYEKSKIRVMPVPNTAIPFAIGIAQALDLPYEMGIERRESTRAFINSTQDRRLEILQRKFAVLREAVAGKVIMIVDDTLIRRDTSSTITTMLRNAGAERVEWLICAPPFKGTCYYGIAVPSVSELAYWTATKRLPEKIQDRAILGEYVAEIETEIARDIGADSLHFLRFEQMLKAFPGDSSQYCQGCFCAVYPTPKGVEKFGKSRDRFLGRHSDAGSCASAVSHNRTVADGV
jgi:amidophosphoribosyltransferase